ncbi:MAG: hypothetical protein IJ615_02795 [Bacteroidaceae bacterium]|nr:hypothetical protein [Bacteroidaceae bacterium]
MKRIGIDIGTSSICGVVCDEEGRMLRSLTRANDAAIEGTPSWAFLQDAERILDVVKRLLEDLMADDVASIGFSGQMHGIVYVDASGQSVSPLYTWQDGSAAQEYADGKSYAKWLTERSGYEVATGYGLATHFYHLQRQSVPATAVKLCTIMDYVAMRLCRRRQPLQEPSNAASLGLFNKRTLQFDREALRLAGIDESILPEVCPAGTQVGLYGRVPVFVPIGDNQAAFLGSVSDKASSLHVTIGTSSQLSVYSDEYVEVPLLDTRPLPGGGYLLVGAALCGGSSFALLKDFYAQVVEMFTGSTLSDGELYGKMCRMAAKETDGLTVQTTFDGTRQDAAQRGTIAGIGLRNFSPDRLTTAFLKGICGELRGFYGHLPTQVQSSRRVVVGSGNGLRKNVPLQQLLAKAFGLPVLMTDHEEEAALGAAISPFCV